MWRPSVLFRRFVQLSALAKKLGAAPAWFYCGFWLRPLLRALGDKAPEHEAAEEETVLPPPEPRWLK